MNSLCISLTHAHHRDFCRDRAAELKRLAKLEETGDPDEVQRTRDWVRWRDAPSEANSQVLAHALGVPPTHQLLTGIAVGVPGDPGDVDERTAARDHRDRVRKPLAEWAFGGGFGDGWVADSGA